MSPRPGPAPSLPLGVNHSLSKNLYHQRDGRREAKPPSNIEFTNQKLISSNEPTKEVKNYVNSPPTPGQLYCK